MYSLVQFCTSILYHSVKLLPTILEHRTLLLSEIMLFIHLLYRICTCILPLLSQEDSILSYYSLLYSQNFEQTWNMVWHFIYICVMNKYITNMGGRSVSMQIIGYRPCPGGLACMFLKGLSGLHWFFVTDAKCLINASWIKLLWRLIN